MAPSQPRPPKRIAIVGGGISGIACLWGLRDSDYEVHLYEAEDKLGGHANSVPFHGNGNVRNVDTGFVVMNEGKYPHFSAFIKALGVETIVTDMSFSVSDRDGSMEWASASFWAFVGGFSNLFRPWFWRLVFDIIRFNHFATDILEEKPESRKLDQLESIREYLTRQKYSAQFKRYYLIPMMAAPWCLNPEEAARTFPAETLIQFMAQHRLLSMLTRTLQWCSFSNGSGMYIDAFVRRLPANHHLHVGMAVHRITRNKGSCVSVITHTGAEEMFDHVVLAVHAEIALQILGDEASALECDVLGAFETNKAVCVLHSDETVCIYALHLILILNKSTGPPSATVGPCCLELYPSVEGYSALANDKRYNRIYLSALCEARGWYVYRHPKITPKSVQALKRLPSLRYGGDVSFAGAWMGYGFHEDGFVAGLQVAKKIIGEKHDTFDDKGCSQTWMSHVIRRIVSIVQGIIEVLD
ncbi:hypothetical protein BDW59DRAFT_163821 [Aspergillus cavernicola]|uniref:Amine oxidase domain-containing protein n=1 Tax=Aspergillus cavernicola TaxID=176166 RepID=A0ABR4I391_9EURO